MDRCLWSGTQPKIYPRAICWKEIRNFLFCQTSPCLLLLKNYFYRKKTINTDIKSNSCFCSSSHHMWPDFSILCDVWTLGSQREPKQTVFKSPHPLSVCKPYPVCPLGRHLAWGPQHSFHVEPHSETGAKLYPVRMYLKTWGGRNELVPDRRTKQETFLGQWVAWGWYCFLEKGKEYNHLLIALGKAVARERER